MLTTLSLSVQDPFAAENYGPGGTVAGLFRLDGDLSQPLVVSLASSDESEVSVPESVTIPAFESSISFPVDLIDDALLDGEQLVLITATAGTDYADAYMLVQDYEEATITFDQSALTTGDTLTGTITVTVSGHTEPLSVPIVSTRPDEIASFAVEIPVGQQSADFAVSVTSDSFAEGPHAVQISIPYDFGLYTSSLFYVSVADAGVNTLQPADDGRARDADQDGNVFEDVATNFHEITTQAAATNGSYGESRGIIEFDTSSIPAGAIIESAILTLDINGAAYFPGNDLVMDVFAYAGDGVVASADAIEINNGVGQLTIPTAGDSIRGSKPIPLDIATIQSLIDGGHLGIVTKMQASTLWYSSNEFFRQYSRPALHLVWSLASGPVLTANSLSIDENQTVVLTPSDLAATDADSDEAALEFTVSNVTHGEFFVAGLPATTFTQAQVAAGLVAFEHDQSEFAPSYQVTVSDGTASFGPQSAIINFTNVNDGSPIIDPGQVFEISENAAAFTIVGTVSASDADLPGNTVYFGIIGGNEDGVFEMDTSGVLSIAYGAVLDFETTSQYVLEIGAFDGAYFTSETITVNVLDGEDIVPVLTIDSTNVFETFGPSATIGRITRIGGDLSQPLTVNLSSSNEAKLTVPATVVFNEFETEVSFLIGAVDDTLLGTHVVTIAASVVGGESTSVDVTVHDVETVEIALDDPTASPGDTLNATISVSTTDRVEPLTVWLLSTRPAEIAAMPVVIDPHQQSVVVPITITADEFPEGLHLVTVSVSAEGYNTYENVLGPPVFDSARVELADPGVTTILPADDGSATDSDLDGNVFELLNTSSSAIVTQAESVSGSYGESRGILEFDVSAIPPGAIIESAVLTIDVNWAGDFPNVNDVVMDVFAYQGNGLAESADANQISNQAGQLTVDTNGDPIAASFPIVLDAADVQSLYDSGDQVGIVTKVQDSLLQFFSKEYFRLSSRPALHLVLAYPPVLTANSLTLDEGETTTLSAANLAADDADSTVGALTFIVSNVGGGQFLVAGSPATNFTQDQIAAGQVHFAHDGSETPPAFSVTVSDGTHSDGPHAGAISFTNVNDHAPLIPNGQTFYISEDATNGTGLGTIAFSDDDLPGDSFTVSILAGNNGGIFAVDNAGNLSVADNSNLDFEAAAAYTLTVRVFDGTNATDQDVAVNVLDVAETKFYVVNNSSNDRTYEYDAAGAALENYALGSGNTGPRGAASTAAGDRLWVLDVSRKVYVYDASGELLGSWTAGTMSSTATPEGIATDGTDVWIVDAKSDKVFKYAGAASRLAGSQSAASSFNLNSANRGPKGIVTDGASLWVVNDSSADKVFKYTTTGSLLGSWAIDSANSRPTGLTIDPTNVSDIWIVDSGKDRVYQYVGAASRTSGSQDAIAAFDLAAGNSNPQGIADPPPARVRHDMLDPSMERVRSVVAGTPAASRAIPFAASGEKTARADKRRIAVARDQAFDAIARTSNDIPTTRAGGRNSFLNEFHSSRFVPIAAGEHATVDDALASIFDGESAWDLL